MYIGRHIGHMGAEEIAHPRIRIIQMRDEDVDEFILRISSFKLLYTIMITSNSRPFNVEGYEKP